MSDDRKPLGPALPAQRSPQAATPRTPRRKLLAATVGLASLSLVGCGTTSGNLIAPPPIDAGTDAPAPVDANDSDAHSEK